MKLDSTICVIWDTKKYPDWILGKVDDDMIIHKVEQLNTVVNNSISRIYILAELKWSRNRTDLYGFTIAKKIREEYKLLCPIVMCSVLNRVQINSLKVADADILKYPGHYLLRLDGKPLETYNGLDEDTLDDINLMMFDPDQKIHELMHATSDTLPGILSVMSDKNLMKLEAKSLLDKRFDLFQKYVEEDKQSDFYTRNAELISAISKAIDSEDFDSNILRPIFNIYKDNVYSLLPSPHKISLLEEIRPHRWEVLFIDDHTFTCDYVRKNFKRNGINCHTATSALDAFGILKKDEKCGKKIPMIITDYRLYENGNELEGDLQEYQGYRILNEIAYNAEYKSHYAFAILTSAPSAIKRKIQKRSKLHVQWFDKSDVLGGGSSSFNLWCNNIIEIAKDAYIKKRSIPDSSIWIYGNNRINPGLAFYYKQHIVSQDYSVAEKELNRIAKKEIEYIEKNSVIENEIAIQASFGTSTKDQIDIQIGNFERLLPIFRQSILLARRIYWVLRFAKCKTNEEIVKIFKRTTPVDVIVQKSLGISINNYDSASLAHTIFKNEILEEEIDFLLENYADELDNELKEFLSNENHEGLLEFFDIVDGADDDANRVLSNKFVDGYKKLQKNAPITMIELNSIIDEVLTLSEEPLFKKKLDAGLKWYFKPDGEFSLLSDKLKEKIAVFNARINPDIQIR